MKTTTNEGYRPKFRLSITAQAALVEVEDAARKLYVDQMSSFSGGSYPLWGSDGEHADHCRVKIAAYAGVIRDRLDRARLNRVKPISTKAAWVIVDEGRNIIHETESHRGAAIRANRMRGCTLMSGKSAVEWRNQEIKKHYADHEAAMSLCDALVLAVADTDAVTEIPVTQLSQRTRECCGV